MANFPVDSFAKLRDAIANAQSGDTIEITTDRIVLEAALPDITKDLTFTSTGRNATISGGGLFQVFRVTGGNVTFTNLTIADGLAQGAAGAAGSVAGTKGGDGLGGGLFMGGGNVTLINTSFQRNQAKGGTGGQSLSGTGGNGGNGLGGAIYVGAGALRISTTAFQDNKAIVGAGGSGSGGTKNGSSGTSEAGAIYFASGSSVLAEGSPGFSGNVAAKGNDTSGAAEAYRIVPPPLVKSINRASPDPTAQPTVDYTVTFSQPVAGVDPSDFAVVLASGEVTGAGVISVTAVNGSTDTYTVRVNVGIGNGVIRLDLRDNDSIRNSSTVPLGSSGLGNGNGVGQTYTVDRRPPVVEIARISAERTAASTVAYTVFFDAPVKGIDTDAVGGFKNFRLLTNGTISGAQVISVKPRSTDENTNAAYDVVVNTGSGDGAVTLQLIDDDSVTRGSTGVPLNGNVDGPTYSVFKTPPAVAAIEPVGNNPTGDATATFRVTFSQDVTGVAADDFVPVSGGRLTGASIASVTKVDPRIYTVVLNTGQGDGSVGLNLVDNDSIRNDVNVALGGAGNGNGNFVGSAFSVIKSAPLVSSIALASPNPTAAGSVSFTVTFNQDVTGVERDDFRMFGSGISGFGITQVSGSGRTYTVTGSTGTGSGTLGLNLLDNDSIRNPVGAPLGGGGVGNGNFTGQSYTVNKRPPRVTTISRLEASPTNAAVVNFTVSFNEAVSGVDSSDFRLVTQGLTGAGITAVTRINDGFYSVTASTGRGEGSIGLNLVDNDSILNSLGLPIGGAGANNGNFAGEIYSIDRTAPNADIIDVVPDPRQDKVDAVTIRFSEAVKGFDSSDVQLTRDGNLVSLGRATLTTADGITWSLGNLRKLTNKKGNYELLLVATGSGVTDAAGNPLIVNVSDRWQNTVDIEVCDPGIKLRGTKGANRLVGTENSDTLLGLAGNDVLLGLDCRDRLEGDAGRDKLIGGEGIDTLLGGDDDDILEGGTEQDRLNGGAGADRFVFAGFDKANALATSTVDAPDRVQRFKVSQSDRFQLDFNDNLNSSDRPKNLFNAGRVRGNKIERAARNAYQDKDQSSRGSQRLKGDEAVFFDWRGATYLAVNDGKQSFGAKQDLVVNVTGIQFAAGDASQGSLTVSDYFA